MKSTLNKDNLTFAGMQGFLWSGFAVYFGFFVPYLKSKGYTELNIGIMMSILSFVGIFAPILWGAASDRAKSTKVILVFNLIAGGIFAQFIPTAIGSHTILIAILILMNLTLIAQPSVLDSWAMRQKSRGAPINYGLVRSAGSLAYAVTSMVAGLVLTRFGMNTMFYMLLGFVCLTSLCVLLLNEKTDVRTESGASIALNDPESPIYKNSAYLLFVLLAMLLFISVTASVTFYPLLLQDAGGTTADIGLALGLCALSEFPVMLLSSWLLRRFKDTTLLLVAMGFYIVRIYLFFAVHSVTGLVWAQLTNSLSFAIFLPTSVHYISRITPVRMRATALTFAPSMYFGLSGILGSLLGGIVITDLGIRALFGFATILAAAVTAAFGVMLLLARRKANGKIEVETNQGL